MSETLETLGMKIIIQGGNNQILPNATDAIQHIYLNGEKILSHQITGAKGIILTEDGIVANTSPVEKNQDAFDKFPDYQQRLSLYI